MSLDLNSLLDLPASVDQRQLILITSDDLNNSSFAFHSLIQSKVRSLQRIQMQNPTNGQQAASLILICLNQSYTHYASIAAKSFGLNLKSLRDAGTLLVADVMKDFPDFSDPSAHLFDMDKFEARVTELTSSTGKSQSPCTWIMIDDVRVLLSQGIPLRRVHLFLHRIRALAADHNAKLVIQSNIEPESERSSLLSHTIPAIRDDEDEGDDGEGLDPELDHLLSYLISCADVWIDFQKLVTGFSDKIDGSLFLYDYGTSSSSGGHNLPVRYHFKTMDRSTRIYTPGTGFI